MVTTSRPICFEQDIVRVLNEPFLEGTPERMSGSLLQLEKGFLG